LIWGRIYQSYFKDELSYEEFEQENMTDASY